MTEKNPFRLLPLVAATFPKGTAYCGDGKVSGSSQRLPLGGAGALAPEGVIPGSQLPQSPTATAPSGMGPLAWRESSPLKCKVPGRARGSLTEGVQPACAKQCLLPQRRAFAESGVANAVSLHDPSRENGIAERPQALRYPEIINNLSAEDG